MKRESFIILLSVSHVPSWGDACFYISVMLLYLSMNVKSKPVQNKVQKPARKSLAAAAFSGLMLLSSCGTPDAVVAGRFLECAGQKQCRVLVNSGSVLMHTENKGVGSNSLSASKVDSNGVTFTTNASYPGSEFASGTATVLFGNTEKIFGATVVSVERGPTKNTAYVTLH